MQRTDEQNHWFQVQITVGMGQQVDWNSEQVQSQKTTSQKLAQYQEIGRKILNSMVGSDKSIVLVGGNGTGKTETQNCYLQRFALKYPEGEIYALLNKNDNLSGVSEERRWIFNPEELSDLPTGSYVQEERSSIIRNALKPIFTVYGIHLERSYLTEAERSQLRLTKPVRLMLGDWDSTYQELKARLKDSELELILSMVRAIVLQGRATGIGLCVDTKSDRLANLGVADDIHVGRALDRYFQDFIYLENREEKGDIGAIKVAFRNDLLCPAQYREEIKEAYFILEAALRNGEIKSPIIFSGVGSKPQIGIVPSFSNSIELNRQKVALADGEESLDQQWADQEAAEYAKLTAQRAGVIEGLMLQDNWTNCHLLLDEWELERNPGVSETYTDDFGITHREFPKEERINYSAIFSPEEMRLLELIWHSCPELQGDPTRSLKPNWEALEARLNTCMESRKREAQGESASGTASPGQGKRCVQIVVAVMGMTEADFK
jgi:hypothetical protein